MVPRGWDQTITLEILKFWKMESDGWKRSSNRQQSQELWNNNFNFLWELYMPVSRYRYMLQHLQVQWRPCLEYVHVHMGREFEGFFTLTCGCHSPAPISLSIATQQRKYISHLRIFTYTRVLKICILQAVQILMNAWWRNKSISKNSHFLFLFFHVDSLFFKLWLNAEEITHWKCILCEIIY